MFCVKHGLHGHTLHAGAGCGIHAPLHSSCGLGTLGQQTRWNDQCTTDDIGTARCHLAHGMEFGSALFQAGAEFFCAAAGVFWLQAGLFTCPHIHVEFDGAV